MRCRRADEIDVEEFLIDGSDDAFEAFRAHYPSCEECAESVAAWSALEWAIRENTQQALPRATGSDHPVDAAGFSGHPSPTQLESFASAPDQAGGIAMQIEAHLTRCGLCRSEVTLLQQFDPALFQPNPAAASNTAGNLEALSPDRPPARQGGIADFLDSLSELFFTPGIGRLAVPALLVALAVALSYSYSQNSSTGSAPQPPVQIAKDAPQPNLPSIPPGPQRPPETPSAPLPPSPDPLERVSPERLAEERIPAASESLTEAPEPGRSPVNPATPELYANAEAATSTVPSAPTTEAADDGPREEILLAALTDLPLPTYRRPDGGGDAGWMGQFGPVRSSGAGNQIRSLAPADHTGLTFETSPRLWWMLQGDVEQPLQLTVVDDAAIDPLLRIELPGPHAAGTHEVDLSDHQLVLPPGKNYRWFISILIDPNRPSRNPVAAGSLRVLPPGDDRRAEFEEAVGADRGHRLAELGIWYDAYDFFARLARAHPEKPEIQNFRDGLANQLGSGQ